MNRADILHAVESPEDTLRKLSSVLLYDQHTGVFTWKVSPAQKVKAGDIAGTVQWDGYVSLGYRGRHYKAHRVAWLFINGAWPNGEIDHINLIKHDNRIANLREATRSQNCSNTTKKKSNTSGAKGVSFSRQHRKWRAQARVNGKSIYIGMFESVDVAAKAYEDFVKRELGEFGRA